MWERASLEKNLIFAISSDSKILLNGVDFIS
jgi:hypothetical protein